MKNNRKCVIFGAGERGTNIFRKLSIFFDVIAYADNNKDLWGRERNGTAIIPPDDLTELVKKTGAAIFIAKNCTTLTSRPNWTATGSPTTTARIISAMSGKMGCGIRCPSAGRRPAERPVKTNFLCCLSR